MNENILIEAERLTSQDRNQQYGKPADDFRRTTRAINAIFGDKIRQRVLAGEYPLMPEDWPIMMVIAKLSRNAHRDKHDNIVDAAGYLRTYQMALEE